MTDVDCPWVDRSEDIGDWSKAYTSAFGELEDITKTRKAEVGKYAYTYADLGDALGSVRPVLAKHGLAVSQPVASRGSQIAVWTTLLHSSGQYVTFTPLEMAAGNTPQTAGSAITYCRRYALMAALGLATDDDDGAAVTDAVKRSQERAAATQPPQEPKLLTARQVDAATKTAVADGASVEDVSRWVNEATKGRTTLLEEMFDTELPALRAEREAWLARTSDAEAGPDPDGTLPLEPDRVPSP